MIENKDLIYELRSRVNFGLMDCKRALVECDWDIEKAYDFLKEFGFQGTRNYEDYENWRYKNYREKVKQEIIQMIESEVKE